MDRHIQQLKQSIKEKGCSYLRIKVIPKGGSTELFGILDDETWKIRLKAAPEKGKANKELVQYLSKLLDVPKSEISIISGQVDRTKLVRFY